MALFSVTSIVECYEMVLAVIMSVPENVTVLVPVTYTSVTVVTSWLLYLFPLLTQVLLWLLAGYSCAQETQFCTPI